MNMVQTHATNMVQTYATNMVQKICNKFGIKICNIYGTKICNIYVKNMQQKCGICQISHETCRMKLSFISWVSGDELELWVGFKMNWVNELSIKTFNF